MSHEYVMRPKKTPRWPRWTKAAIGAVTLSMLSAVSASLITTQSLTSLAGSISDLAPSDTARRSFPVRDTARVFREVEQAPFWEGEPRMYPESRQAIADHFLALNPWQRRPQLPPHRPILSPLRLVNEVPLYAGKVVTLVGRVRYLTVGGIVSENSPGRNLSYVVQISEGNKNADPLIYCLFSESAAHRLQRGQLAVVIGVPIADGAIGLSKGGFAQGAYMVGAMVQPIGRVAEVRQALRKSEAAMRSTKSTAA